MIYSLWLALGFCNVYVFLLRRPAYYETAILGGQVFLLLSLWLFGRTSLMPNPRRWELVLAGLCAGLAFASRPQLILAIGGLFAGLLFSLPGSWKEHKIPMLLAATPAIICGLLVAWFNYARFDSPFQFGHHYQLSAVDATKEALLSPARIPASLYYYLFCRPGFSSSFPFIVVWPRAPFKVPASLQGLDSIIGVFWLVPTLLALLALPLWWRSATRQSASWILALVGAAFAVLLVDASTGTPTMRYQADVSGILYVAAAIGVAGLFTYAAPRVRRWLPAALVVVLLYGVLCNAAIGLVGYTHTLRILRFDQYSAISDFCEPVAKLLKAVGVSPDLPSR